MSILPPPPHPRSWPPPPPFVTGAGEGEEELGAEDLVPYESRAEVDANDFAEDELETTPYHSDYPPPDLHAQQPTWPVIPPAPLNPAPMNPPTWPPTTLDARPAAPDFADRLRTSARGWRAAALSPGAWPADGWLSRSWQQARTDVRRMAVAVSERWAELTDRRQGWLRSRAPYVLGLLVVATSMFSIGRTIKSQSDATAVAATTGPALDATRTHSGAPGSNEEQNAAAQQKIAQSGEATVRSEGGIALPPVPGLSLSPDKEAPILVALAENLLAARRDTEAVPVLERALARNPKLTSDPGFVRVVKRAALSEDRTAAAQAYALLTGSMGERGAEILYEISVSPDTRPAVRERAAYYVYTKDFERKAPLPLYAAFKLVSATSCEAKKSLLPFAAEAGGRHALEYLKELDERKVCSLDDLDNCYSCMNADSELPRTIAEIEARLGTSAP